MTNPKWPPPKLDKLILGDIFGTKHGKNINETSFYVFSGTRNPLKSLFNPREIKMAAILGPISSMIACDYYWDFYKLVIELHHNVMILIWDILNVKDTVIVIFCYWSTLYRNANKLRNDLLLRVLYTLFHINSIMQKWLSAFRLFYNLLISNDNTNNTCITFKKYVQSYVVTLHYYFV